jgi:hypothetical protein
MKNILQIAFTYLILFAACKKDSTPASHPKITQLYPLTQGNKWSYIDSFFDYDGTYYGLDTFYLKPGKPITQNNIVYTPITDQFDEPIFTVRSDDSSVFILETAGEALLFTWPFSPGQFLINNSYFDNTLNSKIYTDEVNSTNYTSYKIIITGDDGIWYNYKQEEFYFTRQVGIIKGYTKRKNSNGSLFTFDSFSIIGFSLH